MSNTDLIIEERSRDIGDFLVGRLLPFRKKRMVGPFIYVDHMGPLEVKDGNYFDIDQHPHIGLSTLTYLLEGEIIHRDSIGSEQRIAPGAVNWMTSGKGCTHTERTPDEYRDGRSLRMHGYQIWVALPKEYEDMDPVFQHVNLEDLPSWQEGEAQLRLVAGEGFGRKSPLNVYSDLFMLEAQTKEACDLDISGNLAGEIGVLIVEGEVIACDNRITKGQLLVSKKDDQCSLKLGENTHVILFGGKAFPEERHIHWNFVSSSREKIEEAKQMWVNKEFPKVPNDETYVPLPDEKRYK